MRGHPSDYKVNIYGTEASLHPLSGGLPSEALAYGFLNGMLSRNRRTCRSWDRAIAVVALSRKGSTRTGTISGKATPQRRRAIGLVSLDPLRLIVRPLLSGMHRREGYFSVLVCRYRVKAINLT